MGCACRDEDGIMLVCRLQASFQDGLSFSINNHKQLVRTRVRFFADFPARRNAHHNELTVRSGVKDLPEELVVLGDLFYVSVKKFGVAFKVFFLMFHSRRLSFLLLWLLCRRQKPPLSRVG